MLRGMGRQIVPTAIVLVGTCVFRMVWIYTVCRIFPGSPEALNNIYYLYVAYPISWGVTAVASLLYYFRLRKRLLDGDLAISV